MAPVVEAVVRERRGAALVAPVRPDIASWWSTKDG
jgi:hypothetical protein